MSNWKGKHGPLLIAEIGGNHEGDFEYAKKLTQLAINTNVDFVKFQIYSGDTLVSRVEGGARNEHFKKFELLKNQHIELAQLCQSNHIGYMASVWDLDVIDWIDQYIPIYKIGSGDLTAYPVLEKIAQVGKPIILSTGLASMIEVEEAIAFIRSVNSIYNDSEYLALLQCTSMYPIPFNDANLNVMNSFRAMEVAVGYSDHTEGNLGLSTSVAMGAQILEFHFTDSREGKVFRDHKISLTSDEVQLLINDIKIINDLKGDSEKTLLPIEIENDHHTSFRRAIYPKRDILAGEELNWDNLTVLRPNHGIDARDFNKVIGKKATMGFKKHQKLDWNLLE